MVIRYAEPRGTVKGGDRDQEKGAEENDRYWKWRGGKMRGKTFESITLHEEFDSHRLRIGR